MSENRARARPILLRPRDEILEVLLDRIEQGLELLEVYIVDKDGFHEVLRDYKIWHDYNREYLRRAISTDELSEEYAKSRFLVGATLMDPVKQFQQDIEALRDAVRTRVNRLESILERLDLFPTLQELPQLRSATFDASPDALTRVFIVHGHDNAAKQTVARLVTKLGLEAIILDEQANRTKTIIEKFEDATDVGFAIVLLTPDDVGAAKLQADQLRARARQNVILELGYFIRALGRDRVAPLKKGDIELPSDVLGVLYIDMDEGEAWQLRLAREMRAAGLPIDLNDLA